MNIKKLENYLKQLAHPFYKRVDDLREEVKREALEKAAEKYPEPFTPASWTSRQLAKHAMAENYDQGVYITGLYEKCVDLEEQLEKANFSVIENCELRKEIEALKDAVKDQREMYKRSYELNVSRNVRIGELLKRNEYLEDVHARLHLELDQLKIEAEYWHLRAVKLSKRVNIPGAYKKPKYADLDD